MVLGAIISIQIGAAIAIGLIDEIGSATVFLRTIFSAILLGIIWRPSYRMDREALKMALAFGFVLAGVNLSFYAAIGRIPLGTAVTLEFTGPLAVALITSRRRVDLLWALMAAAGIVLLTGGVDSHGLEPWGIFLALLAGFFWGCYILLGKRVGQIWSGGKGLAIALAISTVFCLPFGIVDGGTEMLEPRILALGFVVAIMSAALPFSLEMEAMRRLPSNVFGVMMSLEPAIAATVGFLILSQGMKGVQVLAIALVVSASAGALWSNRAPAPVEP